MRINLNAWDWLSDGSNPVLLTVEVEGHGVSHACHADPLFHESSNSYGLPCEGSVQTFARTGRHLIGYVKR
jgi:hypothetical protein